jgi:regulator of sigma E protease
MPLCVGAVAETLKTIYKDIITSLNGKSTRYFDQIAAILESNKGKTIPATILRSKNRISTLIISKEGKLGVQPGVSLESLEN